MGWISIQVTSKGQVHPGITKPGNVPRDRRLSRFKPISTISVDPILVSPSWRPKPSDQSRSFIFCPSTVLFAPQITFTSASKGALIISSPRKEGCREQRGRRKKRTTGRANFLRHASRNSYVATRGKLSSRSNRFRRKSSRRSPLARTRSKADSPVCFLVLAAGIIVRRDERQNRRGGERMKSRSNASLRFLFFFFFFLSFTPNAETETEADECVTRARKCTNRTRTWNTPGRTERTNRIVQLSVILVLPVCDINRRKPPGGFYPHSPVHSVARSLKNVTARYDFAASIDAAFIFTCLRHCLLD